jgi:hypothetical protein
MGDGSPQGLAAQWIGAEAQVRHGLPPRPSGRDAELALEAARLNDAVRDAAAELGFDDQPGDFVALLEALREPDGEAA